MQRVCFLLKVRPDRLGGVPRAARRRVARDAPSALGQSGWHNYSLFLREDGLLVGYLETEDFAAAQAGMAATGVNARWQAEMAAFFEDRWSGAQAPDEAMKPAHRGVPPRLGRSPGSGVAAGGSSGARRSAGRTQGARRVARPARHAVTSWTETHP